MTLISRKSLLAAALLCVAFVAGAGWATMKLWPYTELRKIVFQGSPSAAARQTIDTAFATLELRTFSVASRMPIQPIGGGIDAFGNNVLIMGLRGDFYFYRGMDAEQPIVRLNIAVDDGYARYRAHIADHELKFENPDTYFRFIDVLYEHHGASPSLLVTHHQWHDEEACYTVRLSRLLLKAGLPLERQSAAVEDWQPVYDAQPCLPLNAEVPLFKGHRSGGRIVPAGADHVLMSVGDHGFDGWILPQMVSQDPASDYGKIVLVQVSTGQAQHVSMGHRNPQGLVVARDGTIWSTEHGPQGGDELNLIADGANYGWPRVTYGAEYGMSRWPVSESQNRHDGYVKPVHAWVPSIGVSGLMQIEGFLPEWDGDFLIPSLSGRRLHRLRFSDGRVIFDEPIEIGRYLRDLDQLEDGTIVAWTNDAVILELRPGRSMEPDLESVVAGLPGTARRQVLSTIGTCLQCHNASPGGNAVAAPNLWGVYGRRIAATEFDGYSDALRNRSGRWDDATLDAFLRDVQGFSEGSTMGFSGIPDDEVRSAVIDYLKALRQEERTGS